LSTIKKRNGVPGPTVVCPTSQKSSLQFQRRDNTNTPTNQPAEFKMTDVFGWKNRPDYDEPKYILFESGPTTPTEIDFFLLHEFHATVGQSKYFSYPVNTDTTRNLFLRQQSHLEERRPNTPAIWQPKRLQQNTTRKIMLKNYEPANAPFHQRAPGLTIKTNSPTQGYSQHKALLLASGGRVEAAVTCRPPHRSLRAEFPPKVPQFQLF
jgi:hypothetical protein